MRLASYADSALATRLTVLLLNKGRLVGFLLFVLGIIVYVVLLHPEFVREQYFDEKALLTGLVKREYADSTHLTRLLKKYKKLNKTTSNIEWISKTMQSYKIEVYTQNFTAESVLGDGPVISGTNVYGILRARRSASTEALVLMASSEQEDNFGTVILLALMKYLATRNYWAKDIVLLITSNHNIGAQAWLDSYLGLENSMIKGEPLKGRSGSIQALLNVDINTSGAIEYVNIIPEGINAILPNLDLVFVASKLCELERLNFKYHIPWNEFNFYYSPSEEHLQSLLTAAAVISYQATGLPLNSHGLFLKHRIDSLTLQVRPPSVVQSRESTNKFLSLARALEGILRSLNNLLERFHHSTFFYINTSPTTFISIGQYSPFFGLLLAPLITECIRNWLLRNGEGAAAIYFNKMGIPPETVFPFRHILTLFSYCFCSGWILYHIPSLISIARLPLTAATLAMAIIFMLCIISILPVYYRPTMSKEEWHVLCCLFILFISITLYSVSILNFAFIFVLTVIVALPLSLSTFNNALSRFALLLIFPPLLPVYCCFVYSLIFDSTDLFSSFQNGVSMSVDGFLYAYSSHLLHGAWLYLLCLLYVVPIWLMCWSLSWCKVNLKSKKD